MRNVFYNPRTALPNSIELSPAPKNDYFVRDDGVVELHASGCVILIDCEDVPTIAHRKWHIKKGKYTNYAAYNTRNSDGKFEIVLMHRLLLDVRKGDRVVVDHINKNGLDNRRGNLRLATYTQNAVYSRSARPYRGVVFRSDQLKPWESRIRWRGRLLYLGSYDRAEDAAREYDAIAVRLYGEFAVVNFPAEHDNISLEHDNILNPTSGE